MSRTSVQSINVVERLHWNGSVGKEFEVLVVMFKTKYKYNEWFENVCIQSDDIWLLETVNEKSGAYESNKLNALE
jgi:hypothetical protein